MRAVRIGGPIALIVIGLILALAISDMIPNVDLTMIGWIFVAAGAVWLVIELAMNSRSRRSVTEVQDTRPGGGTRAEYREDI